MLFVVVVFVDLFVPVLKPLLLHGKCICSPWGYNIYLSIFPQNVLYTVVPICNHGSDWFYLHYHVCMLWLVAEWQGPVWFVLLWWNEILLMCKKLLLLFFFFGKLLSDVIFSADEYHYHKMRRGCHLMFRWNWMEIIHYYLDGRPQAHAWSIRSSSGIFYNCMWNCMGIAL